MDDNNDNDTNCSGWEPTDNTSTENLVLSLMMIDDLINEVSLKYPEAKAVFSLLMDDPQISNALKQVDLKKGKSQAYEYVKKMQHTPKNSTIRIIVNDVQRPEPSPAAVFSHFYNRYKVNPRVHFPCYLSPSVNPALWTNSRKAIFKHKKKGFPAANRTQ